MDVYVIGATGFVGGGIARRLAAAGHRVTGLARSAAAEQKLQADGIASRRGDPVDAVGAYDTVVYAAQPDDPGLEIDLVTGLLDRTAGTLLFVSGSGVLLQRTAGSWSPDSFAEDDPFVVEPLARRRFEAEQLVRRGSWRDLRTLVLRPGVVWGPGDHGHVSSVYRSVSVTGSACYVGEGLSTYTHVHIDDLARLAERALDAGPAGALYHAAAGEVPNRWIAEAVARDLGCPTRSIDTDDATRVWGEIGGLVMSASSRCRDPRARTELGWAPEHTDMLSTIGELRLRGLASV